MKQIIKEQGQGNVSKRRLRKKNKGKERRKEIIKIKEEKKCDNKIGKTTEREKRF